MDKAQQEVDLLKTARAQGFLEPIFDYLTREIKRSSKPEEPSGPEWSHKRAFNDGRTVEAKSIFDWLDGRSKLSPDGAQNTED